MNLYKNINKLTDIEKQCIIKLYIKDNLSMSKISRITNRAVETIRRVLKQNNIIIRAIQTITKDKYPIIVTEYKNGANCKEISKKYNVSDVTICNILKKSGFKTRTPREFNKKYSVNEDYFKVINTENKAYFLGLFFADGYVSHGRNNVFLSCIDLSGDDELKLLELFKNDCCYTGPILIKKIDKKYKIPHRVHICSELFRKNLIDKGCVPRKSLILKFPPETIVPKEFLRHFIRGYFDGDGSISFKKDGRFLMSIMTSNFFANSMYDIILKEIDVKFGLYRKNNNIDMKLGGIINILKFCKYIYDDATVFLKRKNDIYNRYCDFWRYKLGMLERGKGITKMFVKEIGDILNINLSHVYQN